MSRLAIGIIIGVALSFISVSLFTFWLPFYIMGRILESDLLLGLAGLLSFNFSYDLIDFVTSGPYDVPSILNPVLLAWLLVGYVAGTVAKGTSRGIMAGILTVVINILLWILLSVLASIDLMSLFQGSQLMVTIGGIAGAMVGGLVGGLLGGVVSGPYEEFY